MKVIFLHDVPRVGRKHDIKEINDGYALNFLIPRKLVERATEKAVQNLELRKKEIVVEREVQESLLIKNLEELKGQTVTIFTKADEKGHLFKGVNKKEIAETFTLTRVEKLIAVLPDQQVALAEFANKTT